MFLYLLCRCGMLKWPYFVHRCLYVICFVLDTLGFCQLFLDCQVEVCMQRNSQRKLPLPEETIHAMVQKIQRPNSEKYKWEQNSLILKSAGYPLADNFQVLDLLAAALENPVEPQEENIEAKAMDRAICAASALHQADQAIRKIVSQIMQNAKSHNLTSCEMKSFAAELNNLKVAFLEDLRHKSNEKNQCCLQNNIFNVNVALLFSQQADDVVKKYLNK
ncbi:hypothetical protein JRQ81_018302 [Phrynocephalus forsythii]|uniref:Uncharacterized protein n=1 Tax=Phrynocephalus forsythii TaxID=171643 RepID=A0A9Q0XTW7_9SAUR|nr:hypothetical protein JRQ81_018302 [Phrynocephalus forsythii]